MSPTEITLAICAVLGVGGALIAFFWRKFDQMQERAQTRNEELINERHREKCAELDEHGNRIRELEQNRYRDMMAMTDRFIDEVRRMETAAHADRVEVVKSLGKIEGAVQLVNQSTDRATRDIGTLQGTVNGLKDDVTSLKARKEEEEIDQLAAGKA